MDLAIAGALAAPPGLQLPAAHSPLPPAPAPLPVLGAHALAARRRQHSLFPATLVHDSHVITTL